MWYLVLQARQERQALLGVLVQSTNREEGKIMEMFLLAVAGWLLLLIVGGLIADNWE